MRELEDDLGARREVTIMTDGTTVRLYDPDLRVYTHDFKTHKDGGPEIGKFALPSNGRSKATAAASVIRTSSLDDLIACGRRA